MMTSQDRSGIHDETTFVDYVPPPPAPVPPPAKYKLWLIVLVLVFFATWFAGEAEFLGWIQSWKILSPDLSLFVYFGVIILCLTYAASDLFVALFTFTVRGKAYGIGPWLRQPRVKWIHKYHNVPAEFLAVIISILEDGFTIFDAPPPSQLPFIPRHYKCKKRNCNVVLRIEHDVDPTKFEEYVEWEKKIVKVAASFEGFESVKHWRRRDAPGMGSTLRESQSFLNEPSIAEGLDTQNPDEAEHSEKGAEDDIEANMENGREEPQAANTLKSTNRQETGGPSHVVFVKFSSIDRLNEYMASSKRRQLMNELEPLLVKPDVVKLQQNRILPDAFTDLLTRQGEFVPKLPPKKWKVAWLTTVALYACYAWVQQFLPYYFSVWGLNGTHPRLQGFISNAVITFLNSFVLTPLFLFLFNDWVRRKPGEDDNKQPWKTLSDGIQWIWLKIFVTFAFYGGCLIALVVKRYA